MKFSLAIYSPPEASGNAEIALQFAAEVLRQGHSIYRLFFFNDGVLNCAQSDLAVCQQWRQLIQQYNLDAIACVASAEKRGLQSFDTKQTNLPAKTINPIFTIGGIAQLIDASVNSDRVITFAG